MSSSNNHHQARPLLRIADARNLSATEVAEAHYGGVIIDADTPPNDALQRFARDCRSRGLSFWLDISSLPARSDELRQFHFTFNDLTPHIHRSNDTRINPLAPGSATAVVATLELFQKASVPLNGVLYDAKPGDPIAPFPWSPHLPDTFTGRHGFNILHRLDALVSGGDEAARIRQQYWDEINLSLTTHFLALLREWCREQDIEFRASHFQQEWAALQLSETLRMRLESSARVLEAATTFPTTLPQRSSLRQLNAALHACANTFVRKYSGNIHSPPEVLFNDIIARSAQAMQSSESAARVGVLFPGRSAQTHYHPHGHRFTRWVGEDLQRVTDTLEALQFDWLFVHEHDVVAAATDESTLRTGNTRHELHMIVVPSVTALSWEAWQKIEQFAEAGGKVACLGLLPRWSERGRDRALEELIGKSARVVIEDLYQAYAALEGETAMPPTIGYPVFREYYSGGRLCCYQPRLNADADDAALRVRQILHESLTPAFETMAPGVLHTHRTGNSNDLFLTWNSGDATQRVNARLRPLHDGVFEELDTATGQSHPVHVAMHYPADEGGGVSFSFELAPGQAKFFQAATDEGRSSTWIERATFHVETNDGETVTGYMTQNGVPEVALRKQQKKIEWFSGELVQVPPPLLMDSDDWNESTSEADHEYFQSVTIPASWKNCRVLMEVAQPPGPVQYVVNGGDAGWKLAAPFRFDITLLLACGASNDIVLRLPMDDAPPEYSPLVRLVAYPLVEVKITP